MQNYLNNFINQCVIQVENELAIFAKNQDPESLHHIRVEIKKIKSVLSFSEIIYKEEFNVKKLSSLFLKAGVLRKRQIEIQLLNTLIPVPKDLVRILIDKEKVIRQRFVENCPKYMQRIKNYRKTITLPSSLPEDKAIYKYFTKMKRRSNKQLNKNDNGSLHSFRKDIKTIVYVNDSMPEKLQRAIGLNKPYLLELQKIAGDWHDTYCTINFLNRQSFYKKPEKIISKLKIIEKKQVDLLSNFIKGYENKLIIN